MAANFKYFAGSTEIDPKTVYYEGRQAFGSPIGYVPTWIDGKGWERGTVKVDRTVEYKARPSRHECDARCLNATGRVMKCECACGGKNHGLGSLSSIDIMAA